MIIGIALGVVALLTSLSPSRQGRIQAAAPSAQGWQGQKDKKRGDSGDAQYSGEDQALLPHLDYAAPSTAGDAALGHALLHL